MNVGWLLDPNVFNSYYDDLKAAILRQGHEVQSVHPPKPPYRWEDAGSSYRNAFPHGSCVVTHGDIDLVQRVLSDGCWTPGAFASIERFYCSHYFSHFASFLLNKDHVMLPFGDLTQRASSLFDTFGRDDRIFVRPDSPLKFFTGLLVSRASFDKDLEYMAFHEFPSDALVIVSSPKSITKEWRFVIANQRIVAASQYKEGEEFTAIAGSDRGSDAFAKSVLAQGYAPDPAWVLDVCKTTDHRYHLLEIGGFSFANLYACDKDAVVKAVSDVAQTIYSKRG